MQKLLGIAGVLFLMFLGFAFLLFCEFAWERASQGDCRPIYVILLYASVIVLTIFWKKSGRPIS